MLALEPGWKSFLFMNLANILLFTNRFLANRAINEKHPMLRVRHLEFLARKGKWDIFVLLVPGPCSKNNMSLLRPALGSDICDELLDKKRFECDPLADDAVLVAVRDRGENILRNHELYSTVKEMERTDLSCARFMVFYEQEPPWNVEWKRYEWGRRLFVRNSGIAGLVLMYCSLVLSFTASLGNKVISFGNATGGPSSIYE